MAGAYPGARVDIAVVAEVLDSKEMLGSSAVDCGKKLITNPRSELLRHKRKLIKEPLADAAHIQYVQWGFHASKLFWLFVIICTSPFYASIACKYSRAVLRLHKEMIKF